MTANDAIVATSATGYAETAASDILGEQYLKVHLREAQPLLFPIQQVVEIIKLSTSEIVHLFQMPAWVMGVYNWRGEVLWMADLGHFLGFSPWYEQPSQSSKQTVVVVGTNRSNQSDGPDKQASLGLLLNRVEGMVFCDPAAIYVMSEEIELEAKMRPFISGYWASAKQKKCPIVDIQSLLEAAKVGSI